MPNIDADIPLPASATEAMPELTPREEIEMRARTVKMISDLTGNPIEPTPEHRGQAVQLMQDVVANKTTADLATYPNETLAYLAGMVAQYDSMIVRDLADFKLYVVNKLVAETEHPDGKIRLGAIKALGEIDGVDAFKKRTEVTHKQQSLEEVEKELLETLAKLEKRTVDVQAKVISSENNA
jgi:hypothetical protein